MKYNFDEKNDRSNNQSIKYDFVEEIFGHKDVIPMWVADMDFKTAKPITDAIMERVSQGIYGYTALTDGYFQSFIDWVKRKHDWILDKDSLIFSPGVVPSIIFTIQALTNPGDQIIIQSPVYGPFRFSIEHHNRKVLNNPLKYCDGQYKMDFDDLEEKMKLGPKMMILCNPHNPVGRVWSREDLEKLQALVVKYNLILISDEIHSDLILKDKKHIPISSLNVEIADRTITCMSPSKTFNLAGLQSSVIVIPNKDLRDKVYHKFDIMDLRINNCFGQVAFEAAYNDGEEWLEQLLDYIRGNASFVNDYIKEHIKEIKTYMPEATYLMWFDCRKLGMKHDMLEKFMNEHAKVGLTSGNFFGEDGQGFMRFNLATTRDQVKESLERIDKAIRHLRM